MKIACLIPARYNSSRFPGKLLAKALGKTVLQYTVESARKVFDQEELFVATDDERIARHVEEIGCNVLWTSQHHINGTDRIAEAVEKTAAFDQTEIIVNLQGDHPCTLPTTLKAVVDLLLSDPKAAMSTVATTLKSREKFASSQVAKVVVDKNGNALYFSRSPIPHCKGDALVNALQHIGLYCFRKDFLLDYSRMPTSPLQLAEDLEQLKALEGGHRIKVAIIEEEAIGIDTPSDLGELIDYLVRQSKMEKSYVG